MEVLAQQAWPGLAFLILLCCSGFLSGSETALFSLSRHELHSMRRRGGRLSRLTAELMDNPRRLLMTLLIGNNTVNILLFAISYLVLRDLSGVLGPAALSIGGVVSLLIVVIFGEVVPKVIASAGARTVARHVAPVIHVFQLAVAPIRIVLDRACVVPLMRLIGRPAAQEPHVTADELKLLLEMSQHEGVMGPGESTWLQQVVDLGEARVHEVMVPRVDVLAFDVSEPPSALIDLFRRNHMMKVPVHEGDLDHVLGLVYARDVLPELDRPLRDCIRPVPFVPEQMRLDKLLEHFRSTHTQTAIVVDEYGGVAGLVTVEDVLEHVVGEIHDEDVPRARPSVERREDGSFSVAGRLSVRVLSQALGPAVLDERVDTLAGLFVAHCGHLPAVGEEIRVANLVLRVESMEGRRIDRVSLRVEGEEGGG